MDMIIWPEVRHVDGLVIFVRQEHPKLRPVQVSDCELLAIDFTTIRPEYYPSLRGYWPMRLGHYLRLGSS